MKQICIFVLLLAAPYLQAQRIEQFYDWEWKRCDAKYARFLSVIEYKDSLWKRSDYFVHERSMQMSGSFTDSSCRVAHGRFKYFYPNRNLQAVGEYEHGKKQGLWLDFFENGMLRDSTVFDNGVKAGTSLHWHSNGYLSDSSITNPDGSGVAVAWFDNGNPASAGRYSAGNRRSGKWQYYHKNGKLSSFENYENGSLTGSGFFDEDGKMVRETAVSDREASFKGGSKGWLDFVERQLYFPSQYKIINSDKAVVVVQGTIDEDGNMTNVEVVTPFYPDFDKIALNALRKSPKWTPAISHNRRVKYQIRQSVIFFQKEY